MTGLQYTPYSIPLILAAITCGTLAVIVWQRRPGPGVIPFLILMAGVIEWTLTYAIELAVTDLGVKTLLAGVEYIGITTIPAAWLAFGLQYTGREKWLTRRNAALLVIEPVIVVLAALTNSSHHLLWSTVALGTTNSFVFLATTDGLLFWLHAAYSYALIVIGTLALVQAMIRSPQFYRGQVATLLSGIVAPWIANVVYISGVAWFPGLDPTPFAFALSGLAFAWSLIRFRLMDVVPVAREAVIDSMSDAMLVLDSHGRVVDINRAGLGIIGKSSTSEAIGNLVTQLLPGQQALIEKYRNVEEARAEVTTGQAAAQRVYELRISPVRNRHNDLTGRVIVLRDISDLKNAAEQIQTQNESLVKANQALAIARKQADEANQLKSQFLATMSHELRTPLNAVIGYAQLLLAGIAGELKQEQLSYQERILINAQHLLKLINEVLDLSKIEAGRMELVQGPFNLQECLNEVLAQNKVLADQKTLSVALTIDDQLPKTLVGDVARIKQIVINLLSNAIKFTEKGCIKVEVQQEGKATWKLIVTDTGIGIPSHMQAVIFDEFRQVDHSPSRQYGGTGLGLAIVRRLVLMMGGTIRVNSEVGQGSSFAITLPLIEEAQLIAE